MNTDVEFNEDGKLIDFLTGTLLEDRPEERVRQKFLRVLSVEYGYDKKQPHPKVRLNMSIYVFKIFLVEFFNEKTRKTITFIGFEYRSYT